MASAAPLISQCYLELDGSAASNELLDDLLEVTVESSLHLPDLAVVTVHDATVRWIDDARLAPGKTLKVSLKGDQTDHLLFDGEIVEIEPEFAEGTPRLVIRAFDRMHRLARGKHVRSFQNVTDGDLVQQLAQEVSLQTQVDPTSQVNEYVFQNNETNLEFLRRRARGLGYLLFADGETLHCQAPPSGQQAIDLTWGEDLLEFRPRLTTVAQVTQSTVRGWDPKQKQEIVGQASQGAGAPSTGVSGHGGSMAQQAFGDAPLLTVQRPVRSQAMADKLAQAVLDGRASRWIEAEGTCFGNSAVMAGATVHIVGVGTRFSGDYFVTSARHVYGGGGSYTTHFGISGHHPSTLLAEIAPDAHEISAPPMGLAIALVTDNNDPDNLGRVKLKYPWLTADHASDWARVVAPGAGKDRGIQFLPEVNDEVLVGFELGDVHFPYVIGGLWNGQDAPAEPAAVSSGKVVKRVIKTTAGHTVILDDTDGGGGITIQDASGNKIVIDTGSNAMQVEVQGDVSIKSQANISLEAQGNLTLKATGSVEISGMGVKVDGGSAMVELKGTMINLN